MSATQKVAWFNLAVVLVTAVLVLALYPALGAKARGGFGLLGLCGLSVAFYWRRRGQGVPSDERDAVINRRANAWAYSVLWIAFVLAAIAAPAIYGELVPTVVVQTSVWVAFMILLGVQSIVALVQYRLGAAHAE